MSKLSFKNIFKLEPETKKAMKDALKPVPDKKKRYFLEVPDVKKSEIPTAAGGVQQHFDTYATPESSMFPNDMVIYKDDHRDFVISTNYDSSLIRPLPIYYLAIGFKGGDENENAIIPLTLHRGYNKSGPIYGYVTGIERHAQGYILNHAYNPAAPFTTTVLDIDAHITREFCDFKFSIPSNMDPSTREVQAFKWKQCKGSPEVMALAAERSIEAHDWSKFDWGEKRGMKLFHEASGEALAVYVAGKNHSTKNPMQIAAKVKWFESKIWTEELKLAAFLALMTFGEKTRRIGSGSF